MKAIYQIKIVTLFLASAFLFANCNNSSEKSKTDSMNNEVKNENTMEQNLPQDFGKNYAAAWSGQDARAHAKFFSPNGSQTVNNGMPAVGHDAIAKVAQGFMDAFPDMLVICDSLPTTSKGVEFHWTLTGTNTGSGGTGKKVHISGVEILQFDRNGLITESNGSFDEKEYNRQIKYGAAD
ncbi:MAG: nuclear transport factor 2 family protein [Ginsengibacter sp.]